MFSFPLLLALVLGRAGTAAAATGGPDSAGYTWVDSDTPGVGTQVPAWSPTDLRAQGFVGDDAVIRVPLPRPFPFYGNNYSEVWLSSNGWLSFIDPAGNSYPVPADIANPAPPNALVAWLWDDWTLDNLAAGAYAGPTSAGDGYMFYVIVAPASATDRWLQVYITLYYSGKIRVLYAGGFPDILTARTVAGIESPSGTPGFGLPYIASGVPQNGANLRNFYAVEYYPRPNLACAGATPLGCPAASTQYSNATGANNVSGYTCAPGRTFSGNERVFTVTVTELTDLSVTLNNLGPASRSLFLLYGCNEYGSCLGGGTSVQQRLLPPGTYFLVVDGATPADNGDFALTTDCTPSATPLACNSSRTGDSTTGTSLLNNWSCTGTLLDGPEHIYSVDVPPGTATVRATLANATSTDLHLLQSGATGIDVARPTCTVESTSTIASYGTTPGRYYFTVDGANGASGTYDLSLRCDPPLLRCPTPPTVIDIANPTPISGDTTGQANNADSYFCTSSANGPSGDRTGFTGPEVVYEFTLAAPTFVGFLFQAASPDMHLLILRDCYEGTCEAEGGCVESLPAGTYRLVVDGLNGAAGAYTLTPVTIPPMTYNQWFVCPECDGGCGQSPDQSGANTWQFNSGNYCGTGCDFSLFAVVECGTNFHIPFWDVESGHMRIYDVFRQSYVNLTATNDLPANPGLPATCLYTDTGTSVAWDDAGCPAGAGADCHTNEVVMDVSFRGSPLVCGVFRLDFINWGGFAWEVYANCTGDRTPQYFIYRDLCSALANYRPRPEVGLVTGTVTADGSQCGTLNWRGTIDVENVGCLPAANYEIVIEQEPPLPPNPQSFTVNVPAGQRVTVPWTYSPTSLPATLTFRSDFNDRTQECHEALGSTVSCGISGTLTRDLTAAPCMRCDLFKSDPISFPPVNPARVPPWVFTNAASCTAGQSRVGPNLELPSATSDVDLSDAYAGTTDGLLLYQLSCPCTNRAKLVKNRATGRVHFHFN